MALILSLTIFVAFSAFFIHGLLNFEYFDGGYRRSPVVFLVVTPIAIAVGALGLWRALNRLRD